MLKCKWAGDTGNAYCEFCNGITMIDGETPCEECDSYESGNAETFENNSEDEKIIIEGESQKCLLFFILNLLGMILMIIGVIISVSAYDKAVIHYSKNPLDSFVGVYQTRPIKDIMEWPEFFLDCLKFDRDDGNLAAIMVYCGFFSWILSFILEAMVGNCNITITDKRVIGNSSFGRRVDLPLDKISSVGEAMFSGISITTGSGKKNFWCLVNREEILNILSDMIINTQPQKDDLVTDNSVTVNRVDNIEEIKKYKELLELGIITQEEFEKKKKQLLDL